MNKYNLSASCVN